MTSATAFGSPTTCAVPGTPDFQATMGQEPAAAAQPNDADLEVLGRLDVWRFFPPYVFGNLVPRKDLQTGFV
jgi:hypothetical protein